MKELLIIFNYIATLFYEPEPTRVSLIFIKNFYILKLSAVLTIASIAASGLW